MVDFFFDWLYPAYFRKSRQIGGILKDTDKYSWHGTTILSVRKDKKVVLAGDGQVTHGSTVIKGTARKVRKIGDGSIVAGFAGATADAFTLFERLEESWRNIPANCDGLASNWQKIGEQTGTSAVLKQ